MKKVVISIVIAGIFSGFAVADHNREEGCKFCKTKLAYQEEKVERLKRELNLTDVQTERLKQIIKEEREAVEKFIKEHRIPIKESIKDGSFKKDIFINTVKENAEKRATIKAEYIEKVLSLLDEDQKKKFLHMVEKQAEIKHERMKERIRESF